MQGLHPTTTASGAASHGPGVSERGFFSVCFADTQGTDPISAGDCKGNPARVLSSEQSDALHASCVIVPMQWACDNVELARTLCILLRCMHASRTACDV